MGGETPAVPVPVEELERLARETMEERAANYVFAGAGDRGHDARQPRGLPPPPDRAAHAARRRRARPLDHGARHARCRRRCCWRRSASRRSSTRTASWRRARAAAARRPADDRQHRLALHAGGDRRGERRGPALVPALLAQRPRAARELRRPRRGGRLRRDRRHRRHLHPRLEAARPAAGLAALPRRHAATPTTSRTRSSAPASSRRPRRTSARRPAATSACSPTPSLTWDDLARLRELTSLPILVKGIQHVDDAREAASRGIDGIVVSNHGGRQVDGAIGSLDALPADRRGRRRRAGGPLRQRHPRRRRRLQGARPRRRRRLPRPPLHLGPGARRPGRASRRCCGWSSPSST